MFGFKKIAMPTAAQALPGRDSAIRTAQEHFVNHHALKGPYPEGLQKAMFGLGCFWGAEKKFWELGDGIYVTAVGYAGGLTPNPIYEEVCSGRTGHIWWQRGVPRAGGATSGIARPGSSAPCARRATPAWRC